MKSGHIEEGMTSVQGGWERWEGTTKRGDQRQRLAVNNTCYYQHLARAA